MKTGMSKYLDDFLDKVDGLYSIIISDREGVPLVKATNTNVCDPVLRPSFLSTFSSHKNSKFGLGITESIVCFYTDYQVIQTGYKSLVVTVIAKEEANTGLILNMNKEMTSVLSELEKNII